MNLKINNKDFTIAELYQPLYNMQSDGCSRNCTDRWASLLQAEEGYNNNSLFNNDIVDWGCSLGWFSFKIAERTDNIIYAIDWDINNINVCNELQNVSKHENIKFIHDRIPDAVPDNIPAHIIFSVLHHTQKGVNLPDEVICKLQQAKIIYLELAHCNEWPSWSSNLIPTESFLSPFHYLKGLLEKTFPNFIVRLIGVHNTHIGSVRPLFQLKAKINEPVDTDLFTGKIIDRFHLPYIDFGDFSLNDNGVLLHGKRIKSGIDYAFAEKENKKYFLKFKNNILTNCTKFIDGFLLSDIIKFGLLPYYDRQFLKRQLSNYNFSNHKDPHPWNFFVDSYSNLLPIDYNDEKTSLDDSNVDIYIKTLMQLL